MFLEGPFIILVDKSRSNRLVLRDKVINLLRLYIITFSRSLIVDIKISIFTKYRAAALIIVKVILFVIKVLGLARYKTA